MSSTRSTRTFVVHIEDLGDGRMRLEVHHGNGTCTSYCVRPDVAAQTLAEDARAFVSGRDFANE